MNSVKEIRVSTGAEWLIADLHNGCTVYRKKGGAPGVVMPRSMPRSGSPIPIPIPMTKGQVSDATIEELLRNGLISEHCTLTDSGSAYYRRYLQSLQVR